MDSPPKPAPKIILVAEDTALVLATVRMILERSNFTVLAAANAGEAIRLAEYAKTIDLLLSDIMMPDMSGPALALKLGELRPDMRVILMSGYDGGEMHLVDRGWHFIQKPFVPVQLVAKINEVLEGSMREQGTSHFDTCKQSDLGRHAYPAI